MPEGAAPTRHPFRVVAAFPIVCLKHMLTSGACSTLWGLRHASLGQSEKGPSDAYIPIGMRQVAGYALMPRA